MADAIDGGGAISDTRTARRRALEMRYPRATTDAL